LLHRRFDSSKSALVCSTGGVAPEKPFTQNAQTKHETEKAQNGKRKYERKKYTDLPRRASNRLPGIEVAPYTELEKMYREHRVANKQDKMNKGTEETKNKFCFLPQEYRHCFEEYCLDQPIEKLLSDPCIRFAIETITEVKFENYYFQTPSQVKHSIEVEQEPVLSIPENIATPNECVPAAEIRQTDKGKEKWEPSSEIPCWMAPFLEISVLSLTDSSSTIHSVTDSNSKSFLQPQLTSSNDPGHS